jgi:hypothetical protein
MIMMAAKAKIAVIRSSISTPHQRSGFAAALQRLASNGAKTIIMADVSQDCCGAPTVRSVEELPV